MANTDNPPIHVAADIALTLDHDRPGTLAKALGCVSAAGINIDGYSECLKQSGFRELQEQDVVVIPVENEPGAAARVFQRIADAHINVRYTYLATGNRLVIASADPNAVIKAVGAAPP